MNQGMVIVGAGEAGARAAGRLRELGFHGPITLVGEEAHAPYERPPLSKAVMTAPEAGTVPTVILDEARRTALSLTHLPGARARLIDRAARRLLLADGRALPFAKLLIATGAVPRRLATPGAGPDTVLSLRTFDDALRLRARLRPGRDLVVIGGGFIGLEIAAGAIARGCRVSVVEMAPRILMRGVPAEVAERIAARHRTAGVDLRTGVGLERIERRGERMAVILSDGEVLTCDAILAGVGALPETALAQASGLAVENGVTVDERLRTEDPNVFAAGDCCCFPHPLYGGRRVRLEAWRNAQDQGAVAAANMLGGREVFAAVPWFWSDQYDETLQVAGLAEGSVLMVERRLEGASLYFHLDPAGRLLAASGIGPNRLIARDIRLAEMMIAGRATPDPAALAAPDVKLKTLLT